MPDENIDNVAAASAEAAPSESADKPASVDPTQQADVSAPAEASAPVDTAAPADVPVPTEKQNDKGDHGATQQPLTPEVVHQEKRSEHRVHVRWHAEALIEGHIWQGYVRDISAGGVNILLEHNCQNVSIVKLHIHVPPDSKSSAPHILDITGKVIYTAYDSDESLFRSGIKFLKFNSPSDSGFLSSFLARH